MTQIDLDDRIKEKLSKYKDEEGIKTYSDAVGMLLAKNGLTQELLRIVRENQQLLKENQEYIKRHETITVERVKNINKQIGVEDLSFW